MSSVPAVNTALYDLLKARLTGSSVTYGRPGKLPKGTGTVTVAYILPARNYTVVPGEQYKIETYDAAVQIEAFVPGDDVAADADTARWALIDACLGVLYGAPIPGLQTDDQLTVAEDTNTPYDKGWVATSVIEIPILRRF